MNKICIKGFPRVLVACLSFLLLMAGASYPPLAYSLTDQELDDLLAPIALYPDPLLAQMLPASTYPTEVTDAAAWLKSGGDPSSIDEQNWDENVKAIAHYPDILKMMADNMDWTADLGDAFLNQPEDVASSIQRLRWRAKDVGNLVNTDQQNVITEGRYIQIVPAQPQYVYIPQYNPSVIYVRRWVPGISPFITFGPGLAIGGWLSMDFDWGHNNVIYHGWNRRGWVNNARPHVHITNVYINRSRPYIGNQTWRHDASHGDPDRYRASRPEGRYSDRHALTTEIRERVTTPTRPSGEVFGPRVNTQTSSNRGRESRGTVRPQPSTSAPIISGGSSRPSPARDSGQPARPSPVTVPPQPTTPTPVVSPQPSTSAPIISGGSSQPTPPRENVQPARPSSVTFGGYRGANEAQAQSRRGEASLHSSVETHPSPAPVSRGSTPAGSTTTGGRPRR